MKIRVAFYKHSKSLFGGLIRFKQRFLQDIPNRYARYSHVEIVFPYSDEIMKSVLSVDDIQKDTDYEWIVKGEKREFLLKTYGLSFSSSEEDGGVRFKFIEWKAQNWDFVEIDMEVEDILQMMYFCRKNNGNSYNWFGIFFAQILNMNFKKTGSYFCSEIVTRILQEGGMLCPQNSLFTSPGQLAEVLEKQGYIIT